jgi:chemotaxis protein methyltransferase CheR
VAEAPPGFAEAVLALVARRAGLSALEGPARAGLCARGWALASAHPEGPLPWLGAMLNLSTDAPAWAALLGQAANRQTSFFRDPDQLEALGRTLAARARALGRPLRLWSAACATGEEAWSLAMVCVERGLDAELVASDLMASHLEQAREGQYTAWSLRNVNAALRERHLVPSGPLHVVGEPLRQRVQFVQHNLLEPPTGPVRGPWDLILCCNVLIYFQRAQADAALKRLARELAPGGLLVLSAAESMPTIPQGLVAEARHGQVWYVRAEDEAPAQAPLPEWTPSPAEAEPLSEPQPRPTEPLTRGPLVEALAHGHRLLAAHDFAGARAAYEEAHTLAPDQAEPLLFLGLLWRKAADWAAARTALEQALFLAPRWWVASYLLQGVYVRLGDAAGAQRERERTRHLLETHEPVELVSPEGLVQALLPTVEAVRAALGLG